MSRRHNNRFLSSVLLVQLVVVSLLPFSSATLSVTATFNQSGISGNITFTQPAPDTNTTIHVSLTGFDSFANDAFPFPWHVHEYPFPHDGTVTPCGGGITGGHFDPLGASTNPNYSDNCNMQAQQNCEVGDLSGKFEPFPKSDPLTRTYSDPFLSLYGVNSIIGRSLVIHFMNGSRLVCANIGYPTTVSSGLLYSPFRNDFKGDIFFRQHTPDNSTSSVYTNLERVVGAENSTEHNWHVHEAPLDTEGENCSVAGLHYNPRTVDISDSSYLVNCGSTNSTLQRNCEIGDLSNKGAPFDVVNRRIQQFYTDTDLPILPDIHGYSIDNRSVVIHAENRGGPRIGCANLTQYQPLEAVSVFNELGISGSIRFYQRSPYDPTVVTINLRGLQQMANGYHVHEYPVGPGSTGSPGKCSSMYTGGHWNPTNIDTTSPGKTSDQFEIGDLSGKFGGLSGLDELSVVYTDPNIPLFGAFSVIGRSVVIHEDDQGGTRWVCSDILRTRQVLQVTTNFSTDSFSGSMTFSQPADDPYAETTITVAINVNQILQPPPVVVSSSTPVEVTPSTIAMTTSTIATTGFLEPTTSVVTMTSNSIAISTSSITMTSSAAPLVQPSTSTVIQDLPTSFTSQLVQPEPTPLSSPSPSPSIDTGSGGGDSLLLAPFSSEDSTVSVAPTNMPSGRRRRSVKRRLRRQTSDSMAAVPFEWSLRVPQTNSGANNPIDCGSLQTVNVYPSNPGLCSPSNQLACASGNLTSKHGALLLPQQAGGSLRAVFTDSNLPLSGPGSIFQQTSGSTPLLLIQPMGGAMMSSQNVVCIQGGTAMLMNPPVEPAPPTTMQADNTTLIIGAAVGGSVAAILLLVLVLVILAVCVKRRRDKNNYNLAKSSKIELGTINPSKPIIGIPNYKALYDYKPQNDGDLELFIGDWVTLKETPYGGDWWRGSVDGRGEGWFPKNFVKYVDVEAEKKKREAENFKLAAAAIVAASTSFSTRHPSLPRRKRDDLDVKPKRAQTFSRRDIDSTPKMVTKFDKPYLQTIKPPPDGVVIANAAPSSVGGSQPGTPASQRSASEVITNKVAMETGSSQEDNNEANKELEMLNVSAEFLISEQYIAKYEFGGSTDIELQFKKGGTVTVIEKADNGWWKGISEGQVGWFPESYVRPAPKETKRETKYAPTTQQQVEQPRGMDEMMASGGDLEASEYRAVHTFESEMQGDLRFMEGETVLVYWADENGWWFGSARSAQGWFPGSYVEPVVESSEAGSMIASPVQLTQEEAEAERQGEKEGSLANQLAAAIKKRKTKKDKGDSGEEKDSRSSFRKRWSLRRKSRDKNKESPSANRTQESPAQRKEVVPEAAAVAAGGEEDEVEQGRQAEIASPEDERLLPLSNEGGDIQNELASAIIRRNSIGHEAKLSIDERLAKAKQEKESEPQNELLKALKKRKTSTGQSNATLEKAADVKSPTEKPPVVFENRNIATGSSQEDNQVVNEVMPDTKHEPKPVTGASSPLTTPTQTQNRPEAAKVEETATSKTIETEQKAVPMTSSTTPTPPPQEGKTVPPRTPESKTRKSVAGRPRRRPPPPPAGGTTAAPPPTGGTTSPANKLSPQVAQPSPKVRKTPAPSPSIHEKPKPAVGQEVDKKPHPSRTAPEIDKSGRSYTTTAAAAAVGGKQSSQPKGRLRPVKRQATANDLKPKYPARRPPPPPPGAVASPPVKQPGKSSPSPTARKAIVTNGSSEANSSTGTPQQSKRVIPPSRGTPVAPPRTKARIQKVKRPISRMIPPPPNIPLPPPPVRKTPPTATKTVVNNTKAQPPTASSTTPQNTSTPPVKAPPKNAPKGPKPAPPTRKSSLTPEPLRKVRLTAQPPPTISEATTMTENKTPITKPTTPPPRRDKPAAVENSPLPSSKTAPVPAKRQQLPSSSEEAKEETDAAPLVTDSPLNRKASKSAPPERPPPPRPPSAASNGSSKLQANSDKPDKLIPKPSKPERPPSLSAGSPTTKRGNSDVKQGVVPLLSSSKVLFDASAQQGSAPVSDSGHAIKPRGGGFMKSLKKIVKRDSNTTDFSPDHRTAAAKAKTPPTKHTSIHKDTSQDKGTSAEPKSPPARPPPASKDHSATAEPTITKENSTTEELKSPPVRPVPPHVFSQDPKATAAEPKPPPARPPPRKISSGQLQTRNETEQKPAEKKGEAAILKEETPVISEANSGNIAPKPRPRKSEVADEKVDKKPEEPISVEEKKEAKTVSQIPSRPPPPRTSPSEKRKFSIPSRPPPPKTPVSKTSSNSLEREQQNGLDSPTGKSPTTSIPEKPKPMPAPRKESPSDLTQKSNGSVNSAPVAPVPTQRQKSTSPTPDEKSPTNPTGTNFYRALKDYQAMKDGELSFSAGDVLIFIERHEKGFYYGMLDSGLTGLFPTSHVEPFFQ